MRELFRLMPASKSPNKTNAHLQYVLNLGLAALAGQVGFVTLAIVLAAVLGGLWLDRQLGTKLLFTILFAVGSGPLSLFITFRLAMNAISKIKPVAPAQAQLKKEENPGE
jgi:magnesium-transporting ATPase (P-type)